MNLECIKDDPSTITLNDCLACTGCIENDELERFKSDINSLNRKDRYSFIISPYSKISIYNQLTQKIKKITNFKEFEIYLINFIKIFFNTDKIIDYSYFYKPEDNNISSECPAVVLYIERQYPKVLKYLNTNKTYQQMAADFLMKVNDQNTKVVSIIQCYDKKDEFYRDNTKIDLLVGTNEFYTKIEKELIDFINTRNLNNLSIKNEEKSYNYSGNKEMISGKVNVLNFLINQNKNITQNKLNTYYRLRICENGCINGPLQLKENKVDEYKIREELTSVEKINFTFNKRIFKKVKKRDFNIKW
ncbi:NAR1 [Hepatospora eriocheir]|uniref:NAR1 n=1 Tax=Hepatospora eriocheir TaxID=1081669 RepID=A0A1X0Q8N3_9MICR|nr:NAR1 [Hepatospora eriocheir]